MVLIGSDTYEDLTPENFGRLIDGFAAGKPPRPGPQIDRQFSAPVGGPTTLTDPGLAAATAVSATGGAPLTDDEAKKPGASANVREAATPKPPAKDSKRKPKPN